MMTMQFPKNVECHVAPYGTMRVLYCGEDMGNKGKMQYLVDKKKNIWRTVAYYADYAQTMSAYHNEIAKNERLVK